MLPEDSVIVDSLKKGDVKMFEKIFRHFYNPLCNYADSILKDTEEAEDAVQQIMITVWEKRNSLEISVSLKSYLYRAVHNGALNIIRKNKVRSVYAEEVQQIGDTAETTAADPIEIKEMNHQIASAINNLPEQCRMVFKLSRFEGMKYSEIASHLNISVKTVENHMGKALKQIRLQLQDLLVGITIAMLFHFAINYI